MPEKLDEAKMLHTAVMSIKTGDSEKGEMQLRQLLETHPGNDMAWYWLSTVVSTDEEQLNFLNQALTINPNNQLARKSLVDLIAKQEMDAADPPTGAEATPQSPHVDMPKMSSSAPIFIDKPAPVAKNSTTEQPKPITVRLEKTERQYTNEEDIQVRKAKSGTYDIFVSYSRKDKPFVQELYQSLLDDGREVWVDWGNIPLTADWREEIREGIERSNAIVFVLSPDFLASEEVAKELEMAEHLNKRLIPVVYRDVDADNVPASLASLNWIFCRHEDSFYNAFQILSEAVDTDLDWVKWHTNLLVKATEWDKKKRSQSLLLRGDDLNQAEMQVAQVSKTPRPTSLQRQYVLSSRQNAVNRQRKTVVRISIVLAISIVLTIFALIQFNRANYAQRLAEEKRVKAELEARIALSRQLGAQAIVLADNYPDLAALLSLHADELDTRQDAFTEELLANLRHSPFLLTSLHQHNANVRSIDFNSDGTLLASGGKDKSILLWDLATRQVVGNPLTGHTDRVTEVVFSPDDTMLASASRDGAVRLWDVATQQPIGQPLLGHTGWVNTVVFSADGSMIASAGNDGRVIVWDVATGNPIGKALVGHTKPVNALAIDPTGKLLASGSADNHIILWDTRTLRPIGEPLEGHESWVNGLDFNHDGSILASASADRSIILWDTATGKLINTLTGHPTGVTSVSFSPDGKRLVSGSEDDTVVLWDVETGWQLGWPLAGHSNSVLDVAFSPDGKTVASASSDSTIALWDTSAGEFFVGHTNAVRDVAFSPDGNTIASGGDDTTVRLWHVDTPTENIILGENGPIQHTDTVWGVSFSPDAKLVASGAGDGTIILWDVESHSPVFPDVLQGHEGVVLDLSFSPDGQTFASSGEDGNILLWDTQTGEVISKFRGHSDAVIDVAFSPDGKYLASGSNDNTAIIWDLTTGQPIGDPLAKHTDSVNNVDFSPDGNMLATGSSDNLIVLWDVKTGQALDTLHGHRNRVTSLDFSPDGQVLASGSYDKNIILWDVAQGVPLAPPLIGHTNDVNSVAWSPDGKTLVSGSWDDTLILWKVNLTPWQERACEIANRTLTPVEWVEFAGNEYELAQLCAGESH